MRRWEKRNDNHHGQDENKQENLLAQSIYARLISHIPTTLLIVHQIYFFLTSLLGFLILHTFRWRLEKLVSHLNQVRRRLDRISSQKPSYETWKNCQPSDQKIKTETPPPTSLKSDRPGLDIKASKEITQL